MNKLIFSLFVVILLTSILFVMNFKKPISCHLFPIRTQKYKHFEAVNYEEIKICKPACGCGSKLKIPLYVFLKDALIRMYGSDWYEELLEVAKQIRT